jgi:hypothetical protein
MVYNTSLIVLEGQGIDVILGMNWMKRHRALLDTAAQTVHLALTPVTSAAVHYTVA